MLKLKFKKLILGILLCICAAFFACGIFAFSNTAITAHAATPVTNPIYWGVQNGNTLVFNNVPVTGTPSGSFDGNAAIYSTDYRSKIKDNATVRNAITTVNFVGEISPVNTDSWFENFSNLKTVTNGSNLKMDNVTYASNMFCGCSKLESIDVSEWDVSKNQEFGRMFSGCSKLQNLDVSKWNTSNADAFLFMFEDCSSLTSLDVSGWDTAKSYHMNGVFKGCSNLTEIDVSGWKTSNVAYFTNMFNGCSKLQYVDLSGFDFSSAVRIDEMFNGVSKLEVLKLSASAVNCFKNPPPNSIVQDPKLPTLKSNDGKTTYTSISSLPDSGTFLTNVAHTHVADASDDGVPTDPTCTAGGYTTKTCIMCDENFKVDLKNALGHDYVLQSGETVQPTCITSGSEKYKCSRCDATKTETLNATGIHTGGTATCTAKAKCGVCNQEYGSLLPHTEEIDPAEDATCTEKGKTAGVHCSVCN
ncbi:MAG: DUF285 domain-containing protein, partial [Clostridia bacterium]|nr:DUF285 domain-containing protein [Clostridia bacterium]